MSKLSAYYQKQQMARKLQEELQSLEQDSQLKKEFDLVEQLNNLMRDYDASAGHLAELLYRENPKSVGQSLKAVIDEAQSQSAAPAKANRKPRKLMRFTNPHTGEVLDTRGGNNNTLKEWRAQYGKEQVDNWKELLD